MLFATLAVSPAAFAQAVPTAPSGFALQGSGTTATLTWTAVSGATTYNLYRSASAGGEGSTPYRTGLPASPSAFTDTGLVAQNYYFYKITAVGPGGESAPSTEIQVLPVSTPTQLAIHPGNTQLSVSWGGIGYATGYKVYRSTLPGQEGTTPYQTLPYSSAVYADTGLTNGQTYYYQITALTATSESARSAEISSSPVSPLPPAPTGLAAASGDKQIALSWTASSGATSYNVYASTVAGTETGPPLATVSATTYTQTGLLNCTKHYYVVTAVSPGGESAWSTEANTWTYGTAAVPTGLQAIPGSGQVSLSWNGSIGLDKYNVYRSTSSGGPFSPVGSVNTSYTVLPSYGYVDTGLTNGTTYYYQITAVTGYSHLETAPSGFVSVVPGAAPAAPSSLSASGNSSQISLSWPAVTGASRYNVYWTNWSYGGPGTELRQPLASVTSPAYIDMRAPVNTGTFYWVTAVSAGGLESSHSPEVQAVIVPSMTGLSAKPGNGQVSLSWNAGTGYYGVYRSTASGGEVALTGVFGQNTFLDTGLTNGTTYYYKVAQGATNSQSALSSEASAMPSAALLSAPSLSLVPGNAQVVLSWPAVSGATGYKVYRATTSGTETLLASPSGTGTSYTDAGLTNGTAYYYQVTSVNGAGESAQSGELATTPLGPPPAPAYLSATAVSSSQIQLSWAACANATGYNLEQSLDGKSWSQIASGSGTSYLNTGLATNSAYFYRVIGTGIGRVNGSYYSNDGGYSQVATASTGLASVPSGLTAIGGNGQIVLSWSAAAGATSYNLYRGTAAGAESATAVASGLTSTSYTDTGLTNGTAYYYKLTAVDASGESGRSNEASAVPAPPPAGTAIYTDSLLNGWQASGSAGFNLNNASPVHSGSASISVTAAATGQGITFSHSAFNDSAYGAVSFWVNPGAATNLQLTVSSVPAALYSQPYALSALTANTWQPVTVPLVALTAVNASNLSAISIQCVSGSFPATFYVDDVSLVPATPLPQLVLTAAGVSAGYHLTTFASHYPYQNPSWAGAYGIGPGGIEFSGGGVLVGDIYSNIRSFPTDTDGQDASTAPVAQYNPSGMSGLGHVNGQLYLANSSGNSVYQLNANGTINQTLTSTLPSATGIVGNPATGHLFVSTANQHQIYDVDPTKSPAVASLWLGGLLQPDGLALSGDGKKLYAAMSSDSGNIVGYDTATKAVVFDYNQLQPSSPISAPDGIVVGTGALAGKLVVNTNYGNVYQIDRVSGQAVLIASGGSRGDFMSVDPNVSQYPNGSYLLTQTDQVMRLIPPSGTITLLSVSVSPGSVTGGASSTGTVTLSGPAPAGGLTVALSSSDPAATVPAIGSVNVMAGSATATFPITTTSVTSAKSVLISAVLSGVPKTATLTVNPTCTAATLTSLTATSTSGAVTLSGSVLSGGEAVSLTSSNPAVLFVPSSVLVVSTTNPTTFTLTPGAVPTPTAVTITASYHGVTRSATVYVSTNPQVPQGAPSVTFPATGTDSPTNYGIDIINSSGTVVASQVSGNNTPNGWTFSISTVGSVQQFSVQAPASAVVASGYEVRAYGSVSGSTFFDVVPSGYPASGGSGAAGGGSGGVMALTSAGKAQGFALSTFVSGFPSADPMTGGGPVGSAITPSGTVLISDVYGPGSVYQFVNKDNQTIDQALTVLSIPTHAPDCLVQYHGSIYAGVGATNQVAGINQIAELNSDGSIKRIIADHGANGIDVNYQTGHLICTGNPLVDIDTQTGATKNLFSAGFDGLVVSSDGAIVYGADNGGGNVYGYSLTTYAQVRKVPISSPDGLALGTGTLSGYLFVNTNAGKVYQINLSTGNVVLIASGGTRGDYIGYSDDGSLFLSQSTTILRLTPPPGAAFGQAKSQGIYTRDDLTHTYSAFSLSASQTTAAATQLAAFDTTAITGTVIAAQMQRAGQVNFSGTQFDLQQGVGSILYPATTSFAPIAESAQNLPNPNNYALAWALPSPFITDINTQLGDNYILKLTDQISSLCGSATVTDAPPDVSHQSWPAAKNILTFSVAGAHNPQIPQGRSLDVSIASPGSVSQNLPVQGTWDILLNNTVVASSGNPAGWYAEDDHTAFVGVSVTVPTSVVVATGYTVRFSGQASGAGRFDVVPNGTVTTAGILQPLILSKPVVIGSGGTAGQVTATLTLDAPAPKGGATVTLTSSNPSAASVPAYVVIPYQQTMVTFTVSTVAVAAPSQVQIKASYNGYRVAALAVVDPNGTPPTAPVLSASAGDGQVTLSWNAVSGATSYTVYRATVHGGPYALVFAGLPSTGYTDAPLNNGTTYYYVVSASNIYGEGAVRSNEAAATPLGAPVAPPTFSTPTSGNYSVQVSLSDTTPGSVIHYTLDGTMPTEASPVYSTSLTLYNSTTTVLAKAYKSGHPPSAFNSQTYTVTTSLNMFAECFCGGILPAVLLTTDPTDSGTGNPAKFYKYQAVAGQTVTITVNSSAFSPAITLRYQAGYTAQPSSYTSGAQTAQLTYSFTDNAPYTIEVTSTSSSAAKTGPFTLTVDCGVGLVIGGSPSTSGFTLSPTVVTGGISATATVTINKPAPGDGVQVALSSNVAAAQPPALVTIAPGQTRASVPIPTTSVTTGTVATIKAQIGTSPATLSQTLTINPPGTPPTVTITSPTNATAPFTAPGPIAIMATATASGTGVTVSKVEFFADAIDLGTSTSSTSPYSFSWSGVAPGTYALTARATDSHGLIATSAPVPVTVNPAGIVAKPMITPPGGSFTSTQSVTITDATAGASIYYTLDGTEPTKSSPLYTGAFPLFSKTTVKAKAFLTNYTTSLTASAVFTFTVTGGTDAQPVVSISSPVEDANLTGPTPVIGTVTIGSLASWQLSYRLVDSTSPWIQFAAGASSVNNQMLGTLDTTLLLNGLYEIQLSAVDNNGLSASTVVRVAISGNQKVGYFTFSYVDLTLPAAGLPIQVTRTYDSRDKSAGDFGTGWKLGLTNIRLQKDGAIGDGWNKMVMTGGFFNLYYLAPSQSHMVTVTFPTGECFRFEANLPQGAEYVLPPSSSDVQYTPMPGTKGSLSIVGGHSVTIIPGFPQNGISLIDADSDTGETFDRTEFLLTTVDGRQFDIDQFKGLLSIKDRNGNMLNFTQGSSGVTGITSSSLDANGQTVAGRGVSFTRTGGFITQISDLNSNLLKYVQTGGDLTSFTDRSNYTTTYTYDANHNVTGIKDARNIFPLRNEYDGSGRLLDTIDAHGHKVKYAYNLGLRQETVTDRLGQQSLLGYDAYGNVTSKTQYLLDGNGNLLRTISTSSAYGDSNNPDKPTQTFDALGNETDYAYDGDGNATQVTQYLPDANGILQPVVTKTTYNAFKEPLKVTDASGKVVTTNTYDDYGNLKTTKDALDHETDFDYNVNGTLKTTTDALGHVTTYSYNDSSHTSDVTTVKDANNHSTTFTYDANGNKKTQSTTRTNAANTVVPVLTQFAYDASDRLQTTTYPDNTTTQTFYNSIGKVDYTLDALSRKTSYTYDDFGQLQTTTYPDITTTSTTYDAGGQVLTRTDKVGRISGSVYDSLGRVVASGAMDAQGNFLRDGIGNPIYSGTSYDDAGQVLAESDPRGNVTQSTYDTLGRKTTSTDALGYVTQYAYDADGRQVSVLDANKHQTTYDYDDAGRLTTTHYPDNTTSQTKYDALGRRTDQTDPLNHTTHYDYDLLGRLWKVTDPMNHVTTFGYDELGEKVSQTDANNHVTKFAYDNRGRLIQKMLPLGQSEAMDYTAPGGQLWHKYVLDQTGATVHTTTFAYQPTTLRLSSKSDTDEDGLSDAVSYQYNPDGSRSQVQRVRGNTTVTTTYGYYPNGTFQQGQLQTTQTVSGSLTLGPISYSYDAAGNKLTAQTPSGTTAYAYDADNRLSQVTHKDMALTKFTYDAVGNRQTEVRQATGSPTVSSITSTYGYDALNRLLTLTNTQGGTTLSSYTYALYLDGKRHTLTDNVAGTTTTYSYYDAGWLKEEQGPSGDWQYAYDNVGNRQSKTLVGTGTQTYLYDNNDRLGSESGYLGGVSYGYDAAGNMTGVGAQTYLYDFENRLISVTQGGTSVASYAYDGDGNRIYKADSTGTLNYLVDTSLPYTSVVEERSPTNVLQARYDYGDDLIRMDRGGVYYYLYDGLGSTRQLVSAAGAVTDRYGYDAYGIPSHSFGATANPFEFNGQQYDSLLGLYFLRARYYAPGEGRFLSQDPYSGSNADPVSLHRYLYASNDPSDRVDPSGQDDLAEVLVSTSISTGLQSLKSSVDLEIYNTVYNDVEYGTGGAIGGFAFGAAIRLVGPTLAKLLGKGLSAVAGKLGRALAQNSYKIASELGAEAALGSGCFIDGTLVQMADKTLKPIEHIRNGDSVQSRDPKTKRTAIMRVVRISAHKVPVVLTISFSSAKAGGSVEEVTATTNHPFYLIGKGFVRAGQLAIGNAVVTRAGPALLVKGIKRRYSKKGFIVHNFIVSHFHTYFVGAANGGLWVHNGEPCDVGNRIVLGLGERLKEFSERIGGTAYNRVAGNPNGNGFGGSVTDFFTQMQNGYSHIYVDLTAPDGSLINAEEAATLGANGREATSKYGGNVTNWEIYQIKINPQWWTDINGESRIHWYYNGSELPDPPLTPLH